MWGRCEIRQTDSCVRVHVLLLKRSDIHTYSVCLSTCTSTCLRTPLRSASHWLTNVLLGDCSWLWTVASALGIYPAIDSALYYLAYIGSFAFPAGSSDTESTALNMSVTSSKAKHQIYCSRGKKKRKGFANPLEWSRLCVSAWLAT